MSPIVKVASSNQYQIKIWLWVTEPHVCLLPLQDGISNWNKSLAYVKNVVMLDLTADIWVNQHRLQRKGRDLGSHDHPQDLVQHVANSMWITVLWSGISRQPMANLSSNVIYVTRSTKTVTLYACTKMRSMGYHVFHALIVILCFTLLTRGGTTTTRNTR